MINFFFLDESERTDVLILAYEPSLDQVGHKYGPFSAQVNVSGLSLEFATFLERVLLVNPPNYRYLCQESSLAARGPEPH